MFFFLSEKKLSLNVGYTFFLFYKNIEAEMAKKKNIAKNMSSLKFFKENFFNKRF